MFIQSKLRVFLLTFLLGILLSNFIALGFSFIAKVFGQTIFPCWNFSLPDLKYQYQMTPCLYLTVSCYFRCLSNFLSPLSFYCWCLNIQSTFIYTQLMVETEQLKNVFEVVFWKKGCLVLLFWFWNVCSWVWNESGGLIESWLTLQEHELNHLFCDLEDFIWRDSMWKYYP